MDRSRRHGAALRRAASRRAGRQSAAGPAAPRRPHDRRRAVVGAAGAAGAVRAGQPVRRARPSPPTSPCRARCWPSPTSTSPPRPGRGSPTAPRSSPPKSAGSGWIVLVHTTANAEWSNLALSGLFVQMLRRIVGDEPGRHRGERGELPPLETLDGFGRLQRAPPNARPIAGKDIAAAMASPQHPPGFYGTARCAPRAQPVGRDPAAEADRRTAGGGAPRDLRARRRDRHARAAADGGVDPRARRSADRLRAARPVAAAAGAESPPRLLLAALALPPPARADDAFVVRATSELRLAYVQDRQRRGRRREPRRSRRSRRRAQPAHRGRDRRPDRRRYRNRRADLFPAALLAGDRRPAAAVAAGGRAHQPLSRDRRHDPVRHPRRRRAVAGAVWRRRDRRRPAAPARPPGSRCRRWCRSRPITC